MCHQIMEHQQDINYNRIAKAIEFINANHLNQPGLDEIAEHIDLSPFHFQRLFTEWAGTSPKKFLQYISVNHAKKLLQEQHATLFDAAFESGLSSSSRLHDLFVTIEGMTPNEYKNGGKDLIIHYYYNTTPFGNIIVASTNKGICHLAFEEDKTIGLNILKAKFPNAQFLLKQDIIQDKALSIFQKNWNELNQIKLHLKGTEFQIKVWESLLKIPTGNLRTYGNIAKAITQPNASRAVGTAIGSNPVAFIIPCHRVIQSTGQIGGYMWGPTRKTAIIGWESAHLETNLDL